MYLVPLMRRVVWLENHVWAGAEYRGDLQKVTAAHLMALLHSYVLSFKVHSYDVLISVLI